MRKTKILPWTEEWENSYREEEKVLLDIFKDELLNIFHIGSTSISTISYAKPIIDILMVVKNIEKVDVYNGKMLLLGYEPKGENGILGRRYFSKGAENRTHHIHTFQVGNENIKTHLNFKQYLLEHPMDAKRYGELKVRLAKQFPDNAHEYQIAKEPFVNKLVEKVKYWASKRTFS